MNDTTNPSMSEGIGKTGRTDFWWLEWVLMASALTTLLLYSSWVTMQGDNYLFGPYRSPFYPFDFKVFNISPALFIFWVPVLFRFTCYYWRKVYYKTYFFDPPACAVGESRVKYNGENKFPFILQNLHRYCVFLALILITFHWIETAASFYYKGSFGFGVGNVIILADSVFLTIYVFSCHALRHIVGGGVRRLSCNSCGRLRHRVWSLMSIFNERHGIWAWISLVSVIVADLYIRLLATGVLNDINTWSSF